MELLHQVNMLHHDLRPDLFKPHTTKYDETQLRQLLSDESTLVFVYEQKSVLGYAFVRIEQTRGDRLLQDRRTLYLDDLCVDETARGKHVGSLLFDYVRRWAEMNDCQSVTLNVWAGNDTALRFYQKAGMHIRKTCMELTLETPPSEKAESNSVPQKTIRWMETVGRDGWRRWGEMDGDGGERWMGMRKGNKVAYFFVSGL